MQGDIKQIEMCWLSKEAAERGMIEPHTVQSEEVAQVIVCSVL